MKKQGHPLKGPASFVGRFSTLGVQCHKVDFPTSYVGVHLTYSTLLPLETKLQYLGLNQKDAESLAPLFYFSKSCAEVSSGESVN